VERREHRPRPDRRARTRRRRGSCYYLPGFVR
jgi:hypothetical protein